MDYPNEPIDSIQSVRPGMLFLRGVLALAFAAFCLAAPALTLLALTFTVAAYLAADGVVSCFLQSRGNLPMRSWVWSVGSGAAGIVTGTMMFFFPMATTLALGVLTGVWALSLGIFQLLGAFAAAGIRNRGARITLGACGVVCTILGMVILVQPWIGVITLLALLATSAMVVAAASFALSIQLRKQTKNAELHELPRAPQRQRQSA